MDEALWCNEWDWMDWMHHQVGCQISTADKRKQIWCLIFWQFWFDDEEEVSKCCEKVQLPRLGFSHFSVWNSPTSAKMFGFSH